MKINRRNTIIGLGTIVAGGGAALGSGAFSQVEARRGLEVNVVTDSDIAEEFVDIVIKADSYNSIGISDDNGDTEATVGDLFPDSNPGSNDYDQNPNIDDGTAVSLVQNDVMIVFGAADDGETFDNLDAIPANSTVTYDDLFEIINDDANDDGQGFEVTFEVDGDPNFDLSFPNSDLEAGQVFGAGSATEIPTTELDTGDGNDTGELTITIEESP